MIDEKTIRRIIKYYFDGCESCPLSYRIKIDEFSCPCFDSNKSCIDVIYKYFVFGEEEETE